MSLYIVKFGGSSVAGIERMKHVAKIISGFIKQGHKVVVVTSAMHGKTDKLVSLARIVSVDIDREYDAIISCGEQIAAGMLARILQTTGIPAQSLSASQVPIYASGSFGNASITSVGVKRVFDLLDAGIVSVITGFQGIDGNGDIITLGRGGSDATACALSYYLNADECYIYTDVDGVHTGDPRIAVNTRLIPEMSYDEMLELSFWGAKVLQHRSVEIAKRYNVKIRILSSFTEGNGTLISGSINSPHAITGVAHSVDFNLLKTSEQYDNSIKVDNNLYLIPKNTNFSENVDVNVGTITVVGGETNKMATNFLISLKSIDITPKFVLQRRLSTTFIVPRSQIEQGVNVILDLIA